MSEMVEKVLTLTWGHPNATYTSNEHSKVAMVYYVPRAFSDFRQVMLQKCCTRGMDIALAKGSLQYQDAEHNWIKLDSQEEYEIALEYIRFAKSPVYLSVRVTAPDFGSVNETDVKCVEPVKCAESAGKIIYSKSTKLPVETNEGRLKTSFGLNDSCRRLSKLKDFAPINTESHRASSKIKFRSSNSPPAWFDKYMQKFKQDLLSEVSEIVKQQIKNSTEQEDLQRIAMTAIPNFDNCFVNPKSHASTSRDHKCHKQIKKAALKCHGTEKKLKKLNLRLEQLEMKRTRLMEWNRKYQEQCQEIPNILYDVNVLSPLTKPHVAQHSIFTKKWHILNSGSNAWDDKTEIRLVWHTQGLKPQNSTLQCPPLKPGQQGEITMTFEAPDFPGLFESYWHFYHDDTRFGQWMGNSVIVDPAPNETSDEVSAANSLKNMDNKEGTVKLVDFEVSQDSVQGNPSMSRKEDRAEYDSDYDDDYDNNIISHSDNQTSSESDDSESFVHVPMPKCYQYKPLPLYNILPGDDLKTGEFSEEIKVDNTDSLTLAPREADSEEEEFVEASGTVTEQQIDSPPILSQQSDNKFNSPGVQILPNNFMSGAINVASLALSATEAIMKSIASSTNPPQPEPLIPLPVSPIKVTTDQPQASTSSPPAAVAAVPQSELLPAVPVFMPASPPLIPLPSSPTAPPADMSPELRILQDMGFKDVSLNMFLLARYKNDVNEVVGDLIAMESGANTFNVQV